MYATYYPGHEHGCGHSNSCPHIGGASLGMLVQIANTGEEQRRYLHRQLDSRDKSNSELVAQVVRLGQIKGVRYRFGEIGSFGTNKRCQVPFWRNRQFRSCVLFPRQLGFHSLVHVSCERPMGRSLRVDIRGGIYHALNCGNAKRPIFFKDEDYEAFDRIVAEGLEKFPIDLIAYQWMNNHWHMVLSPHHDGVMGRFLGWVTLTHTQRYHAHHGTAGWGHVYQGRFKSFPVQDDDHFHVVCRYVERNALTAKLVKKAEDYRWGSLSNWLGGKSEIQLAKWPVRRLPRWVARVNQALTKKEIEAIERSETRGAPFGDDAWVKKTVKKFGLESTTRPRGRPKKLPV